LELETLHQDLRSACAAALKGSDYVLAAAQRLAEVQKEIPGCVVGTCDLQVAKRSQASAVVSVEAVLVKGEYSFSLRMFETREGALLGKASADQPTWQELRAQVVPAVASLTKSLLLAHAAALAAMTTPQARYHLKPPAGTPSAWSTPRTAPAAARPQVKRVNLDADQGQVSKVLRDANPALNACYEVLLAKKKNARGRMVVVVDVEPDGKVSDARVEESELSSDEMEGCVLGRVRRMQFPPAAQPAQVKLPLVFVPSRK
jgi:TonB family protein